VQRPFITIRNSNGAFLLEVMLALSILSIFLVTSIKMLGSMISAYTHMTSTTQAMYLLEKKAYELKASPPEDLLTEGIFDEPFSRFEWTCHLDTGLYRPLKTMALTIQWKEGTQPKQITQTTVFSNDKIF